MSVASTLNSWFDTAAEQFTAAVQHAGAGPDRRLRVAGLPLQLQFAGDALGGSILPALSHLEDSGASDPAFTVVLWDSASTATPLPPPPWESLACHERGNTRAFDDERFTLNFDRPTDVFVAVDLERRLGLFWTRDASQLPAFDAAAPLRRLFQGWLRSTGRYVVHASAIGTPDGGMLLAGRGGSGKSTTAVRALDFDLGYAGDDFCLVESDPRPCVHSLYNTARLNSETLAYVGHVRSAIVNADKLDREKALFFVQQYRPERIVRAFPLRAIVLPHVARQRETVVTAASPLAAYRAIGPDTALRTLGDTRGMLAMLKGLVYTLPCYDLALGTDDDGIRHALHEILARS